MLLLLDEYHFISTSNPPKHREHSAYMRSDWMQALFRACKQINSHFGCAKAPGLIDRKQPNIRNMGSFTIGQSRELSRCRNGSLFAYRPLVKPFGFSVSSRWLKRAGLHYWNEVEVNFLDDLETFLEHTSSRFFFYSSHATRRYTEISYRESDYLIFGSETQGLPNELWKRWPNKFYTIPKRKETHCLNLANAVSIVLYEAWRQLGFVDIKE